MVFSVAVTYLVETQTNATFFHIMRLCSQLCKLRTVYVLLVFLGSVQHHRNVYDQICHVLLVLKDGLFRFLYLVFCSFGQERSQ